MVIFHSKVFNYYRGYPISPGVESRRTPRSLCPAAMATSATRWLGPENATLRARGMFSAIKIYNVTNDC